MSAQPDHELDRLLAATANVVGWDDPTARERLLQAIRDEPRCTDHTCHDCYPPAKENPMTTIDRAWTVAKVAIMIWAVAVVGFLVAAMVFGEDLP